MSRQSPTTQLDSLQHLKRSRRALHPFRQLATLESHLTGFAENVIRSHLMSTHAPTVSTAEPIAGGISRAYNPMRSNPFKPLVSNSKARMRLISRRTLFQRKEIPGSLVPAEVETTSNTDI